MNGEFRQAGRTLTIAVVALAASVAAHFGLSISRHAEAAEPKSCTPPKLTPGRYVVDDKCNVVQDTQGLYFTAEPDSVGCKPKLSPGLYVIDSRGAARRLEPGTYTYDKDRNLIQHPDGQCSTPRTMAPCFSNGKATGAFPCLLPDGGTEPRFFP